MEKKNEVKIEDYTELMNHRAANPIKYVRDESGYGWLCDKEVDPHRDLRKQGCWRCDEMAFPTGGR
jgi:hypothetical protein